MASVYESKSYKDFLRAELDSERFGRGSRLKLAQHLGVQMSFISQVLGGDHDFSVEHGLKISAFLGLHADEIKWFILMISRDRAGSHLLKQYYVHQLEEIKKTRSAIQAELKSKDKLTEADLEEYYGAWYNIAVHMCIRNPLCQDPDSIAKALKVDRMKVAQTLKILEKIGFAKNNKGKWQPTDARFHFGKPSLALRAHHTNWRHQAIRSLDEGVPEDLHYSLVLSIDSAARDKIRAVVLEAIKNIEPEIQKAKDEDVHALTIDFFGVSL